MSAALPRIAYVRGESDSSWAEEMHAAVVAPHAAVHGERDPVRPADELAGFATK
jgi:hypothetical protein